MTPQELKYLAEKVLAIHSRDDSRLIGPPLIGWKFAFDRAKRRFGCCDYKTRTISMSLPLVLLNVDNDDIIVDTLFHELAHAKTPGAGHGYAWKRMAMELGADPARCFHDAEVIAPEAKYVAYCPNCSKKYGRHKFPKQGKRSACHACCKRFSYGRFDERFLLVYRLNINLTSSRSYDRLSV
jgi:predicted SprT family Zn-dependent metalloprotease